MEISKRKINSAAPKSTKNRSLQPHNECTPPPAAVVDDYETKLTEMYSPIIYKSAFFVCLLLLLHAAAAAAVTSRTLFCTGRERP